MPPVLALYEDILSDDATLALPPLPRMIFVVHGSVTIADRTPGRRRGLARRGGGDAQCRQDGRDLLAFRARIGDRGRAGGGRRHLARKACRTTRDLAAGRPSSARRQCRLSAWRLRLSAPALGTGHPLPHRGRHPHRYPRALDLVWAGRRVVRDRPRRRFRPGRGGSAEPFHQGDGPAARADRKELVPIRQRGGQGEAAGAAVQDFRGRAGLAASGIASDRGPSRCTQRRSALSVTHFPIWRHCWRRPRRCAAATCWPALRPRPARSAWPRNSHSPTCRCVLSCKSTWSPMRPTR